MYVTKDASDIKVILRNYYEELYVNKLENLDKMDEFLENITYQNSFDKLETKELNH